MRRILLYKIKTDIFQKNSPRISEITETTIIYDYKSSTKNRTYKSSFSNLSLKGITKQAIFSCVFQQRHSKNLMIL